MPETPTDTGVALPLPLAGLSIARPARCGSWPLIRAIRFPGEWRIAGEFCGQQGTLFTSISSRWAAWFSEVSKLAG
jgi:hypothetical protein